MFEAEYKTFRSNIADLRKKAVELFELKAKFLKEPDETAIDDLYVDSLQRVSNIHIHVIKALIDSHLAASSEINNINIEITG
jgi:hypothetical protein